MLMRGPGRGLSRWNKHGVGGGGDAGSGAWVNWLPALSQPQPSVVAALTLLQPSVVAALSQLQPSLTYNPQWCQPSLSYSPQYWQPSLS